jgi:hypothetical protein
MGTRKIKLFVISVFVIVAPLGADFCYNLGKYTTISDTMAGTFKMYMPVFSLLVAVLFILARDYRKLRS